MNEDAILPDAEFNSARGREPRADGMRRERRRRRAGTINRGVQMTLDIFSPDQLDTQNWTYRWANDDKNRLAILTRGDDFDFVSSNDIEGFSAATSCAETHSESVDRIRMIVGTHDSGAPKYAYLVRKPRDWHEADMDELVQGRADMMEGRVFSGKTGLEIDGVPEEKDKDASNYYVPASETLSLGGVPRRRGPVVRTKG